nr:methyltransferase domain-containing protein [Gammaproteobacteria bacterium]
MLRSVRIYRLLNFVLCLLLATPLLAQDDRTEERLTMVKEQIESYGIRHQATLNAMRTVPRHLFVPDEMVSLAYKDRPLPIGYGQTISQPLMVAIMTEYMDPGPGLKVLEIGTGSGYQAAILAATGARVFTIEIIPELAKSAEQRLQKLGYN